MAETSTFDTCHLDVVETDGVKRFVFEQYVFERMPAHLIYPKASDDAELSAGRFFSGEQIPFERPRLEVIRAWVEVQKRKAL